MYCTSVYTIALNILYNSLCELGANNMTKAQMCKQAF